MKKDLSLFCITALLVGLAGMPAAMAQTQTGTASAQTGTSQISDEELAVNQDNYAAWDAPEQAIGPNHRTTFRATKTGRHLIEEIGTGMNYWDGNQWSPSVPVFEAVNGGFAATQVQHQVHLASNLFMDGAVRVQTPDGITLNSTPLAIALYDSASGNFQVISTVTNCAPTQVSSNEVMYVDAFDGGVCASVVYTITAGMFHQDVMITGHLDPADYGFPTNTTQIQIVTEFYDAPTPDMIRRPIYVEQNQKVRAKMVSPDLVDETLGFGQFVLTTGKAYTAPNAVSKGGNEAPVVKEYKTIAGRTYLFESVPFMALAKDLLALPDCGSGSSSVNSTGVHGYAGIPHPSGHLAKVAPFKVASNFKRPGVVIDYVANIGGTLSGVIIFKGDTTYLVSSAVYCNGATTIEGGAVFKYKAGTSITLNSTLTCKTGMYRPAVFTGVDDNTVGDTMNGVTGSGYTGTISSSGYANPALASSGALTFSGLRFRYAQEAIRMTDSSSTIWTVLHSQFINCVRGITLVASTSGCGCGCGCGYGSVTSYLNLYNCLMSVVQYPVNNTSSSCGPGCGLYQYISLLNCTFDQVTKFDYNSGSNLGIHFQITNSVFANLSALTNSPLNTGSSIAFAGAYNGFYSATTFGSSPTNASSSPFQTVGAGAHYLTSGSGFRDYGGSSLPASLAADLKLRTTYPPPTVTINTTLTTPQAWVPQVQRDADTPDLGYHYDPIDYAYSGVYVTNAAVTLSNGVVVATFGTNNNTAYGLGFGSGSSLSSIGTPNYPNWFVAYNTVMENAGTNGNWQTPTNSVTGELYNATPAPSIYARFTSWSVLAQDLPSFYAPTNTGSIAFQDCEFHDGKIVTYRPTINLTNCLFERVYANLASTDGNSPYIRNNLFLGGTFNFAPNVTNAFVKDNLFDQTSIPTNTSIYTTYNGGYNGFVNTYNRLWPTNSTDVILSTSPQNQGGLTGYQAGPLGFYYLSQYNPGPYLINKGHTTADQVGLYHYTVTTNMVSNLEINETNSVVDIGYHYVAVGTNGVPIDTDGDGLPDYLEDANGNGIFDTGDLGNWLISLYNGLSLTYGLQVFTPLK